MKRPANTSQPWRGHKQHLPSKPCAVCGRPMSWRRAWAKNWEAVRYCSEACRRQRSA
ncbi:hypothetical protein VITFI_CDS1576 [Vitreoscilla filiformis]|uniref:DUF2256 domain-containing protein n=1 Tax=Vitreoscilla filiformis TaxID=63 RepID=A0A221KE80_VITFI|nr:DUF2256 domain-containing protein [Vitreoscilla filiformis]ASM77354.1 hypothetical protein VITFI_CDS1576 [Vitreoscilla filiformis]